MIVEYGILAQRYGINSTFRQENEFKKAVSDLLSPSEKQKGLLTRLTSFGDGALVYSWAEGAVYQREYQDITTTKNVFAEIE